MPIKRNQENISPEMLQKIWEDLQTTIAEGNAIVEKARQAKQAQRDAWREEDERLRRERLARVEAERAKKAAEDQDRVDTLLAPELERLRRSWLQQNPAYGESGWTSYARPLVLQTLRDDYHKQEKEKAEAAFRLNHPFTL